MRRLIVLTVLLLAAGGGVYWWGWVRVPLKEETRNFRGLPIPVVIAVAETRTVPIYLDGLGTVQASALVTVKPMVDGPLLEVRFREGQDVKAGDVLARIEPRTYQAALDQVVAKLRQDEANLANARLDLVRYQKLAATAYTSAQQADTQRALVAQLEAQVAQDQAQIDNARMLLGYTTVVAPVDGRVGMRMVDAGNIVRASDAAGMVVITTLRPISVVFTLPQQSLGAVAAAMAEGPPEVLVLPQSSGAGGASGAGGGAGLNAAADRGTLTVLDNQVDPATGTIKLKASFPNENLRLWPGAFVTVRLRVETRRDAVVVPAVAVQRGPRGTYVFVVGETPVASRRAVVVGHESNAGAVIAEGLKAGERVVVDGAARLSDGAGVNVLPSAGAAPEAPAAAPGARPRRVGTPG